MIAHLVITVADKRLDPPSQPRYLGTITVPEPPAVGDILQPHRSDFSLIVQARAWVQGGSSAGTVLRLLVSPNRTEDWHLAENWDDR